MTRLARWRSIPLLAAVLLATHAAPAHAVLVTPTTSASAEFDVSGLGELSILTIQHSCTVNVGVSSCDDGDTANALLAAGASFTLSIGTTPGGNDLFSRSFSNPFGLAIGNLALPFSSFSVVIGAALDSFFVTYGHVDDEFGVAWDRVSAFEPATGAGPLLLGNVTALQIGPDPEPEPEVQIPTAASLPVLLTALAGFFAVGRFRKT